MNTKKEFFEYDTIKNLLIGISNTRDQALLTIMYASGGRSAEIIKLQKNSFTEKNEFFLISLWTAKNRKHPTRTVPILITQEKWIIDIIKNFLSIKEEGLLFPISTRRLRTLSRKWLGERSHLLRHSRLTHWASKFRVPLSMFWRQAGWASIDPATTYLHLEWETMGEYLKSAKQQEIQ